MDILKLKIPLCTLLALIAFAGNSVLCRLALGDTSIDATSFTIIRLASGILMLCVILKLMGGDETPASKGSWFAALMLFLYAIAFSFAYISLDTGTGALILFGSVQITMILVSMISGNRLHLSEWAGVMIAFFGFVYLIMPGVTMPSPMGFALMTVAGIAWGMYTLQGKGSSNPLADTAFNFIRTTPFILLLLLVFIIQNAHLSREGILLAILSGALTSGVGYAFWYTALGGLSATQAAVLQLLVPVIAAIGGVIFSDEVISPRLILSSALILGGIMAVILGRHYFVQIAPAKNRDD